MHQHVATVLLIFSVLALAFKYIWVAHAVPVSRVSVIVVASTIVLFLAPHATDRCYSADNIEASQILAVGILVLSEIVRTITQAPADFAVTGVAAGHIIAYYAPRLDCACNITVFSAGCAVAAVCVASFSGPLPPPPRSTKVSAFQF